MQKHNPIVITGAHRSGTTWVGKIITGDPSIHYVHEPFNIDYKPNLIKPDFWFQYLTPKNEEMLYEHMKKLVTPGLMPVTRKGIRRIPDFFFPPRQRVLIKDPIAVFSAQWLASRFNMDMVILIRHPAAFVNSIRERNWTHDFNHFLNQPLLMEEHLSPFKDEITLLAQVNRDVFDQAILLWKLVYYMVSKYRKKHHDWFYIRHEDLSADPEKGFREIFRYLKIKFTPGILKMIEDHCNKENPVDGDVHAIKRNSSALVKKWKDKFTAAEIEKIRNSVESISKEYYSDSDW